MGEDIPILQHAGAEGSDARQRQDHRRAVREGQGRVRRQGPPLADARRASPTSISNATTCWWRSARRTPSRGSRRDAGIEFDKWGLPKLNEQTFQSTEPKVFFGGDAAFGPKNIIWAAAHGHDAAISIHKMLCGENIEERPAPGVNIVSQKMGIHEWSYDNAPTIDHRLKVPHRAKQEALKDIMAEVELGFDLKLAFEEAQRCLNCDVQTVFDRPALHRVRRLRRHLPDGLHHLHRERRGEGSAHAAATRRRVNPTQDLYVGNDLKTGRVMVKDEDVCLHCGLCAERCPTGAWDMRKYYMEMTQAEHACRKH